MLVVMKQQVFTALLIISVVSSYITIISKHLIPLLVLRL